MFGRMFRVVSKQLGKSILGYLTMYPRINGQVSKDTLPSKLYFVFSSRSHITNGILAFGDAKVRGAEGESPAIFVSLYAGRHTRVYHRSESKQTINI